MTLKMGSRPPCDPTFQDAESGPGNNSFAVRLPKVVIGKPHFGWIGGALALVMAVAVAAEESHVRARLVADADRLQAGGSFHLGVLLEPEPGWHVYWRNPGEAGLATDLVFDLPDGFSAGELQWPTPVEFEQPGGIIGYGYEEPVVLAAAVTTPESVGAPVPVTVTASWLACKDVCVLGSAKLEAELPLKGAELAASKMALERWLEVVPIALDPGLLDLSVTGGPVPSAGAVEMVAWLNWKAEPGRVEFFPDPGPGLKVGGVRTRTRGTLTRIDFTISRMKTSGAPAESLRSLIVIEDERGKRSAGIADIDID